QWAALIDPALLDQPVEDEDGEWKTKLKEMVAVLKENLQNGESLIITDNLGTAASVRAGYRFTDRVSAQAQFETGLIALGRVHLQRIGDNIHVYKDFGNMK